MNPLPPRTQVLLHASRRADEPSDEQLGRVRRSLMVKIAGASAAAAGLETVTRSASAAWAPGLAVKISMCVAVLGAGAFGGWRWVSAANEQSVSPGSAQIAESSPQGPATIQSQAIPESEPPAERSPDVNLTRSQPESAAVPPSSHRVSAHAGPHAPSASASQLLDEARLLGDVQKELGAGRGASALEKLGEYDQRFADGSLRAEADAARVFALCQSGRAAEARAAAGRFLRRYPASPSASRVRQACSAQEPGSPARTLGPT